MRHLHSKLLSTLLGLMLIGVLGCSSDSGTNSNGDDDGNTNGDPVSFSQDVNPILQSSCSFSNCHGGTPPESGFSTASYETVTGNADHGPLVVPGDASSSNLYLKVTANPPFGERMPRGMTPLSASQINTIRDWINEGAEDN